MIFCITGVDCSGKSTLINTLKTKLNNVIFWKKEYISGIKGKIQAGKELRDFYNHNISVITERVPYIEDIVYNEILEGKRSLFDNNLNYLEELNDYIIIRLTANKETLIERLKNRGDTYINENQLGSIQAKYDSLLMQFDNVITIDTSNLTINDLVDKVYNIVKKYNTMKIGNIIPWSATKLIKGKPFHMCLAHLMKKFKDYKNFYKQEVKNKSYVLMDNGEYEKSILTNNELIKLYNEVEPNEIVLPDSIDDPKLSIEKTINGYYDIKSKLKYKPNYLLVPHGNNIKETCENLVEILNRIEIALDDNINIGLGKLLISGESRADLVKEVDKILDKYWFTTNSKIHLLGCVETLNEMKKIFNSSWRVRSFDSSLPTIFTFAGMKISECAKRPEGREMDWDRNNFDRELLKQNIDKMEEIIND